MSLQWQDKIGSVLMMQSSKILRIVVYASPEANGDDITWDIDNRYYRLGLKLSEIISTALGFQYEILKPLDGEFGRLENGSWTGMVGMVYRGEADLVVSELAITKERSEAVEFSYPFTVSDVTFVTQKPQFISDIDSIFEPFDWEVWCCYALVHIAMPFIFYLGSKGEYTLSKLTIDTFSTFFGQQGFKKLKKRAEKILVITWLLAMMLVSFSYKANLLSILTFPTLRGVRIIPELSAEVQKGTYDCYTYSGSYLADSLATSDVEQWRIIGKNLLAKKGNADIEAVLQITGAKTPAFIGPEPDFMHLNRKYFISDDLFFPEIAAIGMRKDFCCKAKLNAMIHDVYASGLYEKILKEERLIQILQNISVFGIYDNNNASPLSFEQVQSVLFFSFVGYVLAILCFLVELILGRNRSKPNVIRYNNHVKRKMKNGGALKKNGLRR